MMCDSKNTSQTSSAEVIITRLEKITIRNSIGMDRPFHHDFLFDVPELHWQKESLSIR